MAGLQREAPLIAPDNLTKEQTFHAWGNYKIAAALFYVRYVGNQTSSSPNTLFKIAEMQESCCQGLIVTHVFTDYAQQIPCHLLLSAGIGGNLTNNTSPLAVNFFIPDCNTKQSP